MSAAILTEKEEYALRRKNLLKAKGYLITYARNHVRELYDGFITLVKNINIVKSNSDLLVNCERDTREIQRCLDDFKGFSLPASLPEKHVLAVMRDFDETKRGYFSAVRTALNSDKLVIPNDNGVQAALKVIRANISNFSLLAEKLQCLCEPIGRLNTLLDENFPARDDEAVEIRSCDRAGYEEVQTALSCVKRHATLGQHRNNPLKKAAEALKCIFSFGIYALVSYGLYGRHGKHTETRSLTSVKDASEAMDVSQVKFPAMGRSW